MPVKTPAGLPLLVLVLACSSNGDGAPATSTGLAITVTMAGEHGIPVEQEIVFHVTIDQADVEAPVHVIDVALDATVDFAAEPADYDLRASFEWTDETKQDVAVDSGGYAISVCEGYESATVLDGELASVAIRASCHDVSND